MSSCYNYTDIRNNYHEFTHTTSHWKIHIWVSVEKDFTCDLESCYERFQRFSVKITVSPWYYMVYLFSLQFLYYKNLDLYKSFHFKVKYNALLIVNILFLRMPWFNYSYVANLLKDPVKNTVILFHIAEGMMNKVV